MLEVTILKVRHKGINEARKTLPYIKSCDVFGPEFAYRSEAVANIDEQLWEESIVSDMTRTAFKQKMAESLKMQGQMLESSYILQIVDYAFREKIIIYFPERFSEEEAEALSIIKQEVSEIKEESIVNLLDRDIGTFLLLQKEALEKETEEYIAPRDKHISQQLLVAEKNIRTRYSRLKNKDVIKYTMFIGGNHYPENYLKNSDLSLRIVRLAELSDSIEGRKISLFRQNAPRQELNQALLAYGVHVLRFNHYLQGVTDEQIKNMNFEELSDIVRNMKK